MLGPYYRNTVRLSRQISTCRKKQTFPVTSPESQRKHVGSTGPSSTLRRNYSGAALMTTNDSPADPSSPGPSKRGSVPPNNGGDEEVVSDSIWELRTGRAIDILQNTLPDFFRVGLASTNYHLPIHLHGLLGAGNDNGKGKAVDVESSGEGIYSRHIRLEYTPPVALPVPFPRVLSVEGLPLYVASSLFVRATLGTLYTDLEASIHKTKVHTPASKTDSSSSPTAGNFSPSKPTPINGRSQGDWSHRQLSLMIGLLVSGKSRLALGEANAEWDVECTYTFSPCSGLISLHTVNSIHPAPSETVYAAFQKALSKISLAEIGGPAGQGKGAMSVTSGKRDGTA